MLKTFDDFIKENFYWEDYSNSNIAGPIIDLKMDEFIESLSEDIKGEIKDPQIQRQAIKEFKSLLMNKLKEWKRV